MHSQASHGIFRLPGSKYPTAEANVRRAIILRSGGVFAFQRAYEVFVGLARESALQWRSSACL